MANYHGAMTPMANILTDKLNMKVKISVTCREVMDSLLQNALL